MKPMIHHGPYLQMGFGPRVAAELHGADIAEMRRRQDEAERRMAEVERTRIDENPPDRFIENLIR